jgi:hypothetical protein
MRFMLMLRAAPETESGTVPPPEVFEAMNRYNQELAKAGVLVAAEGLAPSSKGVRIRFEGGRSTVTDGPFAETKELIAGFWMLETRTKEEALEWARRAPLDGGTVLEVRQIMSLEDFGDAVPAEVRESEARLRTQAAERQRRA